MKKVCLITTVPGTMKSFVLNFVKYLYDKTNWDITLICDYEEEFKNMVPDYIHYIPVSMKRGISIAGVKAMLEMKRIFKKEKFDFVQYSTPNAAFYASIASKLAGMKIRHYHLMGLRYLGAHGFSRFILKTIEKISCKLSTSIECVSKSNLELGVSEGLFEANKASVVWNGSSGGVDLERFDINKREEWRNKIRTEYDISDDERIIGFVGRITRDKGINELLEAFFKIDADARLMIIGRKEGIETLNQQLWEKAKTSDKIIFVDTVTNIEEYYPALDVLILPSYREGFGNVIIEAEAMGVPVIVSNIPGPVDAMENGKTGLVVKKADSESLTQAMIKIFEDEQAYKQMAENAHLFVEENFEQNKLFEKIYESRIRMIGE